MSLATLKRKSNTTYRKLSGKSPKDRFIINKNSAGNPGFMVRKDCIDYKDPSQQSIHGASNYNSITGTGGGFSVTLNPGFPGLCLLITNLSPELFPDNFL